MAPDKATPEKCVFWMFIGGVLFVVGFGLLRAALTENIVKPFAATGFGLALTVLGAVILIASIKGLMEKPKS